MPTKRSPRRGSMQYWPRKRSSKSHARLRKHATQPKISTFAGYKVGMTQVSFTDERPNSPTKKQAVVWPATIIECPPIKVVGVSLYQKDAYGLHKKGQVLNVDKQLQRKIHAKKPATLEGIKPEECANIRLLVQTQPNLTGIGQKKPEIFEVGLGGTPEDQFKVAQEKFGKELTIQEVMENGAIVNTHAVTKGKGFQGTVKRFGVAIRHHKSEKTKRGPGAIGPWTGGKMTKVPMAGQTGYHTRTERNKLILHIGTDPDKINPKGGFIRYGKIKNHYILVKGSVAGPKKRLIKFIHHSKGEAPTLSWVKQ